MFIFSAFVFVLIFTIANSQRYEFDICKVGTHGRPNHICRKIYDCPTALEAIQQNKIPSVCGFDGSTPIVCCEPSKFTTGPTPTTTSTTTTTTTRRTTTTSTTRKPSRPASVRPGPGSTTSTQNSISIVNGVCTRYKETQYSITWISPQLIGQQPTRIKTPRCPTSVPLVAGGTKAVPKEFPHMALIGYGATIKSVRWNCGGSLISERFVLTAAHCADVTKSNTGLPKWIRLGDLNYANTTEDARPEDFEIIQHILHPNYQSAYVYDDIALLKFDREVVFNEYIRPICLHTSPDIGELKGIATGWGTTGPGYLASEDLLKVTLTFVDKATCDRSFVGDPKLNHGINADKMICAGEAGGGKDTCQGDSGGPIQVKIRGEPCMYSQVGITSFGNAFCAQENSPGGYTRVYNYLPWIQSIVWS